MAKREKDEISSRSSTSSDSGSTASLTGSLEAAMAAFGAEADQRQIEDMKEKLYDAFKNKDSLKVDSHIAKVMQDIINNLDNFSDLNYPSENLTTSSKGVQSVLKAACMGFLPSSEKNLISLGRKYYTKFDKVPIGDTLVNSGNTIRDLEVVKFCIERLGLPVSFRQGDEVALYTANLESPPMIDLTNLPEEEQVMAALRLCSFGLNCTLKTIEHPDGIESVTHNNKPITFTRTIAVSSKNLKHSFEIMGDLLSQGYTPQLNDNNKKEFHNLSLNTNRQQQFDYRIAMKTEKPEILFHAVKFCFEHGFEINLGPSQVKKLKNYVDGLKDKPWLSLNGAFQSVVESNRALADSIGCDVALTNPFEIKSTPPNTSGVQFVGKSNVLGSDDEGALLPVPPIIKSKGRHDNATKRPLPPPAFPPRNEATGSTPPALPPRRREAGENVLPPQLPPRKPKS
jgi:hypothetical protein